MSLLETFAKRTSTSLEKIAATASVTFALYYIFHIILDLFFNQNITQEFSLSILFITGDRQIEFIIIFLVTGALFYIGEPYERLVRMQLERFYSQYILRSDDEENVLSSFSSSYKRRIIGEPIFTKGFYRIYSENPPLNYHFNKVVGLIYLLQAIILFSFEIIAYDIMQLSTNPQALTTNRFVFLFSVLLIVIVLYIFLTFKNFNRALSELKRNGLVTLQAYTLFHQSGSNEQLVFVQNGQWTQIRRKMVKNLTRWRELFSKSDNLAIFFLPRKKLFSHEKAFNLVKNYFFLARGWGNIYQLKHEQSLDKFHETLPKIYIGTKEVSYYLFPIIEFISYMLDFPNDFSNDSEKLEKVFSWFNGIISQFDQRSLDSLKMIICEPIANDPIPFSNLDELSLENIEKLYEKELKGKIDIIFTDYESDDVHSLFILILRHYIAYTLFKSKINDLLTKLISLEKNIGI